MWLPAVRGVESVAGAHLRVSFRVYQTEDRAQVFVGVGYAVRVRKGTLIVVPISNPHRCHAEIAGTCDVRPPQIANVQRVAWWGVEGCKGSPEEA